MKQTQTTTDELIPETITLNANEILLLVIVILVLIDIIFLLVMKYKYTVGFKNRKLRELIEKLMRLGGG